MHIQYSQIIDISLPLNEQTVVYPGNPAIEIEELKSESSKSVISKITLGSHTGTHLDAPKHVIDGGGGVGIYPLSAFIGPCKVIDCTHEDKSVTTDTICNLDIVEEDRVLLKTKNSLRGFQTFYDDFIFLSPEAALYLAEKKVSLVGIDYFSIKQKGSADNRPHTLLLEKQIPILEAVNLADVEAGEYALVALPMRFDELDGTPVRAVLLK